MKELSIEQKARRYDEAIERVENIKTGKCETTFMFTEGLLEHIFPELAESEDERIRKSLIDMLKNDEKCYLKEIAWLEKQGEHKDIPADAVLDSNKDGLIADTIRCKRENQDEQKSVTDLRTWKYIADYVVTKWCGIGQYLDTPRLTTIAEGLQKKYSLKQKQGEQKPINIVTILDDYFANTPKEQQDKDWEELKHLNNFGWELVEQKPWSEEDKKMIDTIIETIKMSIEDCDVDDIGTKARFSLEKERDWLKSLKDRVQPQPQQQWKPTKEQMDALLYIFRHYAPTTTDKLAWDALQTLEFMLAQLKKLREE